MLLIAVPVLCVVLACRNDIATGRAETAPPVTPPSVPQRSPSRLERLRIDNTRFITSGGKPFEWRGITAFRLVDYVADGQTDQAETFLRWAAQQRLTVVRVLTMMAGQFDLRPEDGRRALPRLLELAAAHGLYVEVVALAGTADIRVNLQEHVDGVGQILAAHPNGLLEIANEPVHPSQSAEVQQPRVLEALATRVPRDVPVSLGSIERGDGFGAGSYITWHAPRDSGRDGWGHVHALPEGAALLGRWRKPVVSDEPIGAGSDLQPGRRDNAPARFRAAALLTRLAGLGATFHYEGGIQARVPEGRERECFDAWNEAWTLLPEHIEREGAFSTAGSGRAIVAGYERSRMQGVYERVAETRAWVLALGDADAKLKLAAGWTIVDSRRIDGGRLLVLRRLTS